MGRKRASRSKKQSKLADQPEIVTETVQDPQTQTSASVVQPQVGNTEDATQASQSTNTVQENVTSDACTISEPANQLKATQPTGEAVFESDQQQSTVTRTSCDEIRTIFVSGFPSDIDINIIPQMFVNLTGYCGCVSKHPEGNFYRSYSPVAFVAFTTRLDAQAAIDAIQAGHLNVPGSISLRAEFARSNTKGMRTNRRSYHPNDGWYHYYDNDFPRPRKVDYIVYPSSVNPNAIYYARDFPQFYHPNDLNMVPTYSGPNYMYPYFVYSHPFSYGQYVQPPYEPVEGINTSEIVQEFQEQSGSQANKEESGKKSNENTTEVSTEEKTLEESTQALTLESDNETPVEESNEDPCQESSEEVEEVEHLDKSSDSTPKDSDFIAEEPQNEASQ